MGCINRAAGRPRQGIELASLNERLSRLSGRAGRAGSGTAAKEARFLVAEPPEGKAGSRPVARDRGR